MAIVICDIDGTLLRVGTAPIRKTIEYVNELAKTNEIVLVTGRPSSMRDATVKALARAGVRYNSLRMHNGADSHAARIEFKKKTAQDLKNGGRVSMAIDNDPDARNAYSSLGIPTKSPVSIPDKTFENSYFSPK